MISLDHVQPTQIPLLIQLRYHLRRAPTEMDLEDVVHLLGFHHQTTLDLMDNQTFRAETRDQIGQKLNLLQVQYENRCGVFDAYLEPQEVEAAFREKIPSLKVASGLSNPFAVLRMERSFGLPETGDLSLLTRNWNQKYYSPGRCEEFNTLEMCCLKAIEYNDWQKFQQLYPRMVESFSQFLKAASVAARFGRLDMLKFMIDKIGDLADNFFPFIQSDLFNIMIKAAKAPYDNVTTLEYMFQLGLEQVDDPNHYIRSVAAARCHFRNFDFLLSRPEVTQEHIEIAMVSVTKRGDGSLALFKTLEYDPRVVQPISQNTWNWSFRDALIYDSQDVLDYVESKVANKRSFIGHALHMVASDRRIKDGHQTLRRLMTRPEIDKEMLGHLLYMLLNSMFGPYSGLTDEICDIIVESGKATKEELNAGIERIKRIPV